MSKGGVINMATFREKLPSVDLAEYAAFPKAPGQDEFLCASAPLYFSQYTEENDEVIIELALKVFDNHLGNGLGIEKIKRNLIISEYQGRSRVLKDSLSNVRNKLESVICNFDKLLDQIDSSFDESSGFENVIDTVWTLNNKGNCSIEIPDRIIEIKNIFEEALKLLPQKPKGKKYDKYPISFSASEKLIWDIAWLYTKKYKEKQDEIPVWLFARQGMDHKDRIEQVYAGPFYDLVKDVWRVLEIEDWKDDLGAKTEQALYKLRDISAQICAIEK